MQNEIIGQRKENEQNISTFTEMCENIKTKAVEEHNSLNQTISHMNN